MPTPSVSQKAASTTIHITGRTKRNIHLSNLPLGRSAPVPSFRSGAAVVDRLPSSGAGLAAARITLASDRLRC